MRNLFDQYRHHENRLTHALACCLAEDGALLRSFIRWSTGADAPIGAVLQIVEQRLPGEPELDEVEAERRGLPDAWIFTESGWALLIESKVSSGIDIHQINRHLRTAERRGFTNCRLVLLSVATPTNRLPQNVTHRTWASVYQWAITGVHADNWSRRLADYMAVAERRMLADEYLKEGTLTTFAGIQFDTENHYTYLEAKRLLKLLMNELRKRHRLKKKLGANLAAPGRSSITGKRSDSVWDYIPLARAQSNDTFTSHPHLTLSIQEDQTIVQITVPNGVNRSLRKALLNGGYDGFKVMLEAFLINATPILKTDTGARPFLGVLQRHYKTQRSVPIRDAMLEFDPRTALKTGNGVKVQEQWLKATYDAFSKPKSNLQLAIGLAFPYRSSSLIKHASFVEIAERSWLACRPVLAKMGLM